MSLNIRYSIMGALNQFVGGERFIQVPDPQKLFRTIIQHIADMFEFENSNFVIEREASINATEQIII